MSRYDRNCERDRDCAFDELCIEGRCVGRSYPQVRTALEPYIAEDLIYGLIHPYLHPNNQGTLSDTLEETLGPYIPQNVIRHILYPFVQPALATRLQGATDEELEEMVSEDDHLSVELEEELYRPVENEGYSSLFLIFNRIFPESREVRRHIFSHAAITNRVEIAQRIIPYMDIDQELTEMINDIDPYEHALFITPIELEILLDNIEGDKSRFLHMIPWEEVSSMQDELSEILRILVASGINIDVVEPESGNTLLQRLLVHSADHDQDEEGNNEVNRLIRMSLELGANPNIDTGDGSPLRLAINAENLYAIGLLLRFGANRYENFNGLSAMNYALTRFDSQDRRAVIRSFKIPCDASDIESDESKEEVERA